MGSLISRRHTCACYTLHKRFGAEFQVHFYVYSTTAMVVVCISRRNDRRWIYPLKIRELPGALPANTRGPLDGFALLTALDKWPAVIVNSSIYAFAHFYKGPGETFGSIPGGIVLCWATLMTGNIWTAVIIHSVMALALEWFSIQRNPDMSFIGAKR